MIFNKTAIEIGKMIKKGEISSYEVTKATLENIKKYDKTINAYTQVFEEEALKKAKKIQDKIYKNEITSLLAGVPIGIKDNICIENYPTTSSSSMLKDAVFKHTATVVRNLQDDGAIILGKLNMDEFAMGGSTQTSAFGITRNPWDLERVPGGSSGGSVAAVVADEAFYTLGSDTGGSIRQPCSFCNLTGIKPTYGTVSRYGLLALSPSLDQIGPIAKDVEDCALVLQTISGSDVNDHTMYKNFKFNFKDCFNKDLTNFKIGIPKNYFTDDLDDQVKENVLNSIKIFEKLGATFEEFEIDLNEAAVATYYILSCAEATHCLLNFNEVNHGTLNTQNLELLNLYIKTRTENFGLNAKTRIMLGNLVLNSKYKDLYYEKALKFRRYIYTTFKKVFEKYDLLLTPVCQTPAYKLGEILTDKEAERRYFGDIYTVATNLAGVPGLAIPCGFTKDRLPIGLQLIANHLEDYKLINAGFAFQSVTKFHKEKPYKNFN